MKARTERDLDLIEHWRTADKRGLSAREIAFVHDAYDSCIASLDEQLCRLLDGLARRGVLERTWLMITSDHGESFGEQPGVFGHGTSLYQPQLQFPLVIVPPERGTSPRVIPETVSLVETPATVVDLLRLENGSPFPGRSLARFWCRALPEAVAGRRSSDPALSELTPNNWLDPDTELPREQRRVWATLADGDWIYIHRQWDHRDELFHLRDDPQELHNRAADPIVRAGLEQMRRTLNEMTESGKGPLSLTP